MSYLEDTGLRHAMVECLRAIPPSEVGDFAPGRSLEPLRVIRPGIDDRRVTGGDIGDQMTGAGTDSEAVAAETGGENEAWNGGDLTDSRHPIGGAIHITGPDGTDICVPQGRQEFKRARMGKPNCSLVDLRIEDAHSFHRSGCVQSPSRQGFVPRPESLQSA